MINVPDAKRVARYCGRGAKDSGLMADNMDAGRCAFPLVSMPKRSFTLNLNFNLEDHSMDISLVSAASNSGGDPVPTLMLRKSLDLQAQSVATLLGSMPQVSVPVSNPPHLGQTIDIKV